MICPYCELEMEIGLFNPDGYGLKWVPTDQDMGATLNCLPFVKGIKLTSLFQDSRVKVFYCQKCRKFIIDQDDLRVD